MIQNWSIITFNHLYVVTSPYDCKMRKISLLSTKERGAGIICTLTA